MDGRIDGRGDILKDDFGQVVQHLFRACFHPTTELQGVRRLLDSILCSQPDRKNTLFFHFPLHKVDIASFPLK